MKRPFYKSLMAACLLTSCWASPALKEDDPQWESSDRHLSLPCDNPDGSGVCDTISIVSNRSWSAGVEQSGDWLELSAYEHLNLEEFKSEVMLVLNAADNKGEGRSAKIEFWSDGSLYSIAVDQSALVPRLAASGPGSIPSDAAVYPLEVRSNVAWTARIDGSSTAEASIDMESGEGNGSVNLSVGENLDNGSTKSVRIVFEAQGCGATVVDIVQDRGVPYLKFEEESGSAPVLPARINYELKFRTNVDWTASVESCDGFDSMELSADSGSKDEESVTLLFPPAHCFGKTATARIRMQAEGAEPVFFEISQEPALGMVMIDDETGTLVDEARWPFSSPSKADTPTSKTGNDSDPYFKKEGQLLLRSGYGIGLWSTAGMWYTKTGGMNCGGGAGSYFTIPAVEGHRLKSVYFRTSSSSPKRLNFSVCKDDMKTPVTGGEEVALSASKHDHRWDVGNTEAGTQYYLVNSSTGNFYMAELVFYYE